VDGVLGSHTWVPDHFFAECGAVLRRWDINGVLTAQQVQQGVDELLAWPLRVVQVGGLFEIAERFVDPILTTGAEDRSAVTGAVSPARVMRGPIVPLHRTHYSAMIAS